MGSRTPKDRAENPSNKWVLQAGATSPNAMSRLKELLAIEEGDNRLTKLFPDERQEFLAGCHGRERLHEGPQGPEEGEAEGTTPRLGWL